MDREKKQSTLSNVAARIKSLSRPIPIGQPSKKDESNAGNIAVEMSISPEKIPSVVPKPKEPIIEDAPVQKPPIQKRIVAERFPNIGGFCGIGYVQSDPLPPHVEYILKCGLNGLDFVKIPTTPKTDHLYLKDAAHKLMKLCGINWDDLEETIEIYNHKKEIPENLKQQGYDEDSIRNVMLAMFTVSKYYADRHNVEFLTDPDEFNEMSN